MARASVSLSPVRPSSPDSDGILVVAAWKKDGEITVRGSDDAGLIADLAAVGFAGKRDELVRLPNRTGGGSIAVVGLGASEPTVDDLRAAAGSATRRLSGSLVIDLAPAAASETEAIAEGALLGAYRFDDYRGAGREESDGESSSDSLVIVAPESDRDALDRAMIAADAVTLVKDLVNIPALDLYPSVFADRTVEEVAALDDVTVRVWDEEQLAADGFGGILGVGQGSTRPPRLVRVEYAPEGASAHLALVGKGITFDTGGLSLKPPVSMIGMKDDMAGAATVLATLIAAARRRIPVRLTAWLCLAENMPSGVAIRPGDVLTIRGGRTVEVLNTDAEGRLVMADGLVAASEEQPDAIIDVATLTGAQVVALGNRYVGVMGDDPVVPRVIDAADETGETMWRMPIPVEMRPMLASDIADIANVKPGNTAGGMLVAAAFLADFIGTDADGERIPWAHLDIAGPALNKEGGYGYTGKGPTGVGVRTLLRVAEAYSRA
ncbi:leucyl aminopeptidase [Cnuibacter sp. UC19_7]|uniref:leucyl aminopeptidase n=1 Tax=Cnuibacter sp. UC19_7 TaxID=3350166 RepID=UPI00366F5F66